MCMLTCSILCCWFRVKSGHFLLGSVPLGLVMPSSFCTQGRDGGKEQQCCWKGQGRGSSEDPLPFSPSLPRFRAAWGPGLSHS